VVDVGAVANYAQIISVVPMLGGIGLILHRFNCAEPGCKRLGHPGRGHYCPAHAKQHSTS
jgi:hypothetical protein